MANVTWDAATVTAVTLSGGNLVATNTGTTSGDQGARVVASAGKTSGKYYFEITLTTETGGGNTGFGVATTASTYTAMGSNATAGGEVYLNGGIYANSANSGFSINNPVNGNVIGIAVDLDGRKIWFQNCTNPTIGWNGTSSLSAQNPATNTGGITIPAGTMVPICTFGGTGGASGNVFTANFGDSAFTGAVPSGFTSGWPVPVANTTWSVTDKVTTTLSGGNLIATATGAGSWVRAADLQYAGKFYWEMKPTVWANNATAVGFSAGPNRLAAPNAFGMAGTCSVAKTGAIWVDGVNTGLTLGARAANDVIGIAVDLTNSRAWFRVSPSGNWNGVAGSDPASNSGGITTGGAGGGAFAAFPLAQLTAVSDAVTANFGDSAFTGTVPSGFTSGFPIGAIVPNSAVATQAAVEEWLAPVPDAQVTQTALEMWASVAVAADQGLGPSLVTGDDSFPAPTVALGAAPPVLSPSLVTDADIFFGTLVSAQKSLLPSSFAADDAFFAPLLTIGAGLLTPSLVPDADVIYSLFVTQVTGGGPEQTLRPPPKITDNETIFAPAMSKHTGLVVDAEIFRVPAVSTQNAIQPQFVLAMDDAIPAASIDFTSRLRPVLLGDEAIFVPLVSRQLQPLRVNSDDAISAATGGRQVVATFTTAADAIYGITINTYNELLPETWLDEETIDTYPFFVQRLDGGIPVGPKAGTLTGGIKRGVHLTGSIPPRRTA